MLNIPKDIYCLTYGFKCLEDIIYLVTNSTNYVSGELKYLMLYLITIFEHVFVYLFINARISCDANNLKT